jgi:hypothetical protein
MATSGYVVLSALAALSVGELAGGVVTYRRRAQLRRSGSSTVSASWTLSLLLIAFLMSATAFFYLLSLAATIPRGGF